MLALLAKRVLPRLHNSLPPPPTTTTTATTTTITSTTTARSFVIMPPKRRAAATKSAPADVDAPAAKRQKPAAAAPAEIGKMLKDDEGMPFWGIGGRNRRVAVSEFKGMQLVSIREHYEKDGKMQHGKGISLTVEQLNTFISILPQLETYLASKKVAIDRPAYSDSTTAAEEEPAAAVEEEVDEEEEDDDEEEEELKDDDHEEEKEEEEEEEVISEEEEAKKKKTTKKRK